MCLLLLSLQPDKEVPLLLAANRDEFYSRHTAPLGWWRHGQILSGRDLGYCRWEFWQKRGTWLGVNRQGAFAAVTNYREPGKTESGKKSRGLLVRHFLEKPWQASRYAAWLEQTAEEYNGYNLIFGDCREVWYFSNRGKIPPQSLPPGNYALSNALLGTVWYKTKKLLQEFQRLKYPPDAEQLFSILHDPTPAPDPEVQQTGLPFAIEKALSAVFTALPEYGTRSSSVVYWRSGRVYFTERTFNQQGQISERSFTFAYST
ncbi:MAG: NRDE family protein [Turneriella sp.]|nr:NRDE family protein [Turneriella sp.]